jgi:hypothetical protein
MVAVPPVTPATTPDPETTVATMVLPLVQVPPPASVNDVVVPGQTVIVPVIADGRGFTVTVVCVEHPVGKV